MDPFPRETKLESPVSSQPPDRNVRRESPADALESESKPQESCGRSKRGSAGRLWSWLSRQLLGAVGHPAVSIVLWNGEEICGRGTPPVARILIRDRRTLWRLIVDPMFQFGEAFAAGQLEIDGDLLELSRRVDEALVQSHSVASRIQRLSRWLHKRGRNTLSGSRDNIHRHYDIGNEFYQLWLDEQLVYTCAYFPEQSLTLEQAQIAKMDHICRKLQLQPGETVIEAGCGWGALALHMARHYGVTVRAYNISHEQIVYARRRAEAEDLDHHVEFVEDDWRNITGRCDAFVSVGMLEHVGLDNYRRLGDVIHGCLEADGRGLIHSIGMNKPRPLDAWTERRIFPGAQPPALSQMAAIFEPHNFAVLDVENLRLHYAETLKRWLERYKQSVDAVREMFDERFVRMWQLYLTASIASFETGQLQLFQVVFVPGTNHALPWTRAYQYAETAIGLASNGGSG